MPRQRINKKGQGNANGAAGFILILTILLVGYILLLPADVRDNLLNESETDDDDDSEDLILREYPGKIEPQGRTTKTYSNFQGVDLKSYVEGKILVEETGLHPHHNIFNNGYQEIEFEVEDLPNTQNYYLTYSARYGEGNLIILLNDKLIYNDNELNPNPIEINPKNIRKNNTLILAAESPSWLFWKNNKYNLERIILSADKIDRSQQEATRQFFLSQQERDKFESTKLSFDVGCCGVKDLLTVLLNNNTLYSGIPSCDDIIIIGFDVNETETGRNKIKFESQQGEYSIDRIKVDARFKKPENTMYYFDLTKKQIDKLKRENLYLKINLAFTEEEIIFYINNHKVSPKLTGPRYKYLLNNWAVQGENTILFDPETTIDVSSIEVSFE